MRQMFSCWPMPPTSPYPSAARPSTVACRSATSKQTLRRPNSFAIAAGDPDSWSGLTKFDSSIPVPPSGGHSMTISVRESGMPMTVSRNSPSTNVRPSTSRPNPTKNAVTESRSSTVIPTWSKRLMCDVAAIPQRWSGGFGSGTLQFRSLVEIGRRPAILPVRSEPPTHPPRVGIVRRAEPLAQEPLLGEDRAPQDEQHRGREHYKSPERGCQQRQPEVEGEQADIQRV